MLVSYDEHMCPEQGVIGATSGYLSAVYFFEREYNGSTVSEKEGMTMDAIIGRYRARMENSGLVLTHPTGISFDLTADEALELLDFLKVYRQTLITSEQETNPELERIVIQEHED